MVLAIQKNTRLLVARTRWRISGNAKEGEVRVYEREREIRERKRRERERKRLRREKKRERETGGRKKENRNQN